MMIIGYQKRSDMAMKCSYGFSRPRLRQNWKILKIVGFMIESFIGRSMMTVDEDITTPTYVAMYGEH